MSAPDFNSVIRVGLVRAQSWPCVLCGADESAAQGAFIPNEPTEWGAPEGQDKFFFYALCGGCLDSGTREEVQDKVEAYLKTRMEDSANE